MDMLTLMQGALTGAGLPLQAEAIAGQRGEADTTQTPAAFSDALLNVIDSLMVGQGKPTRELAVSAVPLSQDDDDDAADAQSLSDSLLKGDAPQQLLETLLMTSQQAAHPVSYVGNAQLADDMLTTAAQPQMTAQALTMGLSPWSPPQNPSAPVVNVESAASVLPGVHPVSATLTTAMIPVAAVAPMTTQPLEASIASSPVTAPSSGTATTLKMDPEPSRWSEQLQSALGERLQVQVRQQIQHATIRLDPPEMGKIDISMQVDNGRVQVQINASHAEVYRALQQTSNDLRQSLTEQNFVQVNVQVSSQSGGQQQGRGQSFTGQHNAILAGAEIAASTLDTQDPRSDDSVLLTV